jgi:hypothetical protein
LGNPAVYHDAGLLRRRRRNHRGNWTVGRRRTQITGYKWAIHDLKADPTEANDLAAKMPDKLKEMQDRFYAQINQYPVRPLDNSVLSRLLTTS